MKGKTIRKIIITIIIFLLGITISKFDITLEGKIAELIKAIDSYSFLVAIALIICFLCSFTYKQKERYLIVMTEITLFVAAIIIAVRSLNGNIRLGLNLYSLSNYFLFLFTVGGWLILNCKNKNDTVKEQAQSVNEHKFGHKPIDNYFQLFENRKSQCNLVTNIIKNKSIIDNGYSICIAGEWGSGKTSFIEAVLDKLQKDKITYSEIRINALELENINTLIEYYFSSLRNILDEKGAYSGFKSEYKEMVNSFLKLASSESISNYFTNKLYTQTDYRNNIKELDKLIKDIMKKERIVIVVDDLDRCSDEKAIEVLFFTKEIATMSNCISFYLIDYDKFLQKAAIVAFGEGFLDKFFNRIVAINKADYNEILKKFDDVSFARNINKVTDYYAKRVSDAEKTLNDNIHSDNYKNYKNSYETAVADDEEFISLLSNPRKLIKVHEHYKLLNEVLDEIKICSTIPKETFDKYLIKINYQKQLVLISLLYGFNPDIYTYLECENVDKMLEIGSEYAVICNVLYNEWNYWGNENYKAEKKEFVELIISEPNKIIEIVNPYDSEFSEYTDYLDKGTNLKDKGISFEKCITVLYHNIGINGGEKYIPKAFELYSPQISLDDALYALQSYKSYYFRNYSVITFFYDCFCNEKCKIESLSNCQLIFKGSYQEILANLLNTFLSYIYFLDNAQGKYDGLGLFTQEVYHHETIEKCATTVIDEFGRVLEINFKSNNAINKMKEIIDHIDEKGGKMYGDFIKFDEIDKIRNISIKAINEIDSLKKIEDYLFHDIINPPISDNQPATILKRLNHFKNNFNSAEGFNNTEKQFEELIISLGNGKVAISNDILELLDTIINMASKYNEYRAFKFRIFYLKLRKIKESNSKSL